MLRAPARSRSPARPGTDRLALRCNPARPRAWLSRQPPEVLAPPFLDLVQWGAQESVAQDALVDEADGLGLAALADEQVDDRPAEQAGVATARRKGRRAPLAQAPRDRGACVRGLPGEPLRRAPREPGQSP